MINIRFFPDWGRKEPLWSHDTEDVTVRTEDLDITAELAHSLRGYMDFWENHFNPVSAPPGSGWDSEENQRWFELEGDRIINELSSQLSGTAIISDERFPDGS